MKWFTEADQKEFPVGSKVELKEDIYFWSASNLFEFFRKIEDSDDNEYDLYGDTEGSLKDVQDSINKLKSDIDKAGSKHWVIAKAGTGWEVVHGGTKNVYIKKGDNHINLSPERAKKYLEVVR